MAQAPLTAEMMAVPEGARPAPDSDEANSPQQAEIFQQISRQVSGIFAKCKGAVVRIEASDPFGSHAGTGFFIDPAGTIYTNYSIAGRSWNLTVEFANKKYPAECLVADPRSGVAILRIRAQQTPFLPIGKSSELRVASPVVTIGYPMDLPSSPSFGLVAGFDHTFYGNSLTTTHIRANVPVRSGEQGAPMLNGKGEVVGILVCQLDYGASCLALPIQAAEKVRADYLRFGGPHPGWIGVTVQPVGNDPDGEVEVSQLALDTPAAQCGLEIGDVIEKIGDTPVHRFGDLRDASFYLTADESVSILVRRGGKEVTLKAEAVSPPGESPQIAPPNDIYGTRLALPNAR